MAGLGGLPALDVAIGFVVLFFLLSTVCSAVNEGIANLLGWRAKTLEDAIRNLVGDSHAKASWRARLRGGGGRLGKREAQPQTDLTPLLFDHWRIKGLVRNPESGWRRRARPSYLPPRAFSLALAETLAKGPGKRNADDESTADDENDADDENSLWKQTDDEILERVTAAMDGLPEGQLRSLAQKAALNAGESLDGFRAQVERVFDDSMERASGWYKRKVQAALLVLAAVVAVGLNVDTVRVATTLWNDQPLRTAVATRAAAQGTPEDAAAAVEQVSELELPVGWGANAPDNILFAIPGWLITIAALNLGAPFWFDLLSRLSRLRGSGVPERPRSLSDTPGTVEAEPAAPSEPAIVHAESASEGDPTDANAARGRTEAPPARGSA